MDEISYWIYTKRAPCLMNYDKAKNLTEEANNVKPKPKSVPSVIKVPSPKKKKKRKLSLLDESLSDKQHNVYFNNSQNQKQVLIPSCKSDTIGSEIDFNIRNTSVQEKPRKSKQQKGRTTLHKKNKVVTSTPKVGGALRRSQRRIQPSHNNSQLNSSFEILNKSYLNGTTGVNDTVVEQQSPEKITSPVLLAGGDQTDSKKEVSHNLRPRNEVTNGQFEDLSDVSGFTANYIRSTKIHTKTPRKIRCKNNRNLVKESQHPQKEATMVVCMNKAVNATKHEALNCSTDSENIINLVTNEGNDKSLKVTKSTSLLKFMDSKVIKRHSYKKIDTSKPILNDSLESSMSRYPKRSRNHSSTQGVQTTTPVRKQAQKKRKVCNNSSDLNSERKENPDQTISRTRSGRNIGLTLRQPENSVLVLSNSELVSSVVSMNVADPEANHKSSGKKVKTRLRSRKSDRQVSIQKDSARDKSGFAACFTDSDDDSEPLHPRKYFCT